MSNLNSKHPFYTSADEFDAAQIRFHEIKGHLKNWPELETAIEQGDQELFHSAMNKLSYTHYCMVARLFDLSKEAEHDMTARFNEMSGTYRDLVKVLEFKLFFYGVVITMESPFILVGTGIIGGVLALSIALGKKGSLLPFIDNRTLMITILCFSFGALVVGTVLYRKKELNITHDIEKLNNILAADPKLYEVYGECIASVEPKIAGTIMKLMKNKSTPSR